MKAIIRSLYMKFRRATRTAQRRRRAIEFRKVGGVGGRNKNSTNVKNSSLSTRESVL